MSPHSGPPCCLACRPLLQEVDIGEWFYNNSALPSAPGDPMPLAPVNDNFTAGAVDANGNPANVFS